ncbi:hypothetical protein BDAP_000052 [Binucleata daphniae]
MLQLIYKKKFTKTIVKIIENENTFTCITKSNLQYTHPETYERLDFTPKDIAICNGKYFYIHKENIYEAEKCINDYQDKENSKEGITGDEENNMERYNELENTKSNEHLEDVAKNSNEKKAKKNNKENIMVKTKLIKLPMKFNKIDIVNDELIAINKKIVFLSPYKVKSQLYGPSMRITQASVYENYVLGICYGSNDIYLFQNDSVAVFVSDEQPLCCLLISKHEFLIGCENKMYVFDTNKKKHTKNIDICNVSVIRNYKNLLFIGAVDKLVILEDYVVKQEISYCGFVNDIFVWKDKLVVCTGREMSDGRFIVNKKAKNVLQIYNIQINEVNNDK